MEIDELTDLTVDEQEDELQDLSTGKLENLREQEERRTALDNIDDELRGRREQERQDQEEQAEPQNQEDRSTPDEEQETEPEEPEPQEENEVNDVAEDDRVAELEAKVDYLFEKVKTVSKEGYEDEA